MWIERQLAGELRRLAGAFPVLVLVGPRQVGKTAPFPELGPSLRASELPSWPPDAEAGRLIDDEDLEAGDPLATRDACSPSQ